MHRRIYCASITLVVTDLGAHGAPAQASVVQCSVGSLNLCSNQSLAVELVDWTSESISFCGFKCYSVWITVVQLLVSQASSNASCIRDSSAILWLRSDWSLHRAVGVDISVTSSPIVLSYSSHKSQQSEIQCGGSRGTVCLSVAPSILTLRRVCTSLFRVWCLWHPKNHLLQIMLSGGTTG